MPRCSFVPKGEKFLATHVYPGLEEVLEDESGRPVEFDSAAAAIIYGRRRLREEEAAARAAPGPDYMKMWKEEKAEELRRARERFDMRGVEVVIKKRRRF